MRPLIVFLFLGMAGVLHAQDAAYQEKRSKKVAVQDRIQIDSLSILPASIAFLSTQGQSIDTSRFTIDLARGSIRPKEALSTYPDSLIITYRVYPEFLTRSYSLYDPRRVVRSSGNQERVYQFSTPTSTTTVKPFDGLSTNGSIIRGISVGNNQNSVLNSELDLQISGKISNSVTLRASIQDANIPNQEGGYSQSLDEFDQVFIELFSDNWKIRAGDVDLQNTTSYFGAFTKKIQGLALQGTTSFESGGQLEGFASGALVRGIFTRSIIIGQEGNQGPYKLTGPNGELFVLIVSGSEKVFINGVQLERGELADYIIDYNAGEVRFNATVPITSEMRITVEYQYSERNFTRFIGYGGSRYQSDNGRWQLGAHVYSENDAKNQPLQQSLTEAQVSVLQAAGDDRSAQIAPSAVADSFSENKILYRRTLINGQEVFEFSSDPDEELFNVRFSPVGPNQGDYVLQSTNAISRIFEYVAPVNGVPQGNFAPVVQLFAPNKLQVGVVNGSYQGEKTQLEFEIAGSNNDQNLFSNLDDGDNEALATHVQLRQQLLQTTVVNAEDSLNIPKNQLQLVGQWDYVQQEFRNPERLYNVEFSRDWNLNSLSPTAAQNPIADQSFLALGLDYNAFAKGLLSYRFENLVFRNTYQGYRHTVSGRYTFGNLRTQFFASALDAEDTGFASAFSRANLGAIYGFKKTWVGAKIQGEDNERRAKVNDSLTPESQRFQSYEVFTGLGDSTQVYVQVGYRYRLNDSIPQPATGFATQIERVNQSNTYFLESQLLKNESTALSLFVNYRRLNYEDQERETEISLNSRLLFDQRLFNDFLRWNTVFETNSGTQPRQDFTYIAVDEGQGNYTWNDYNGDGVQQLEEFELAQFVDEADFVRLLLPNRVFVKTHQNKWSQQLTLNPQQWSGRQGFKKVLSRFYNQTSYIIDRNTLRQGKSIPLNPFREREDDLGVNLSFRNTLFFNRAQQRYTTSYTYLSSVSRQLLTIGLQESDQYSHQLNFLHKIKETWLFNLMLETGVTSSFAENFPSRNFSIDQSGFNPRISYLFNLNSRIEALYEYQEKSNTLNGGEALVQHNLGIAFAFAKAPKLSMNGEFKYIQNDFQGSTFSPVAYQILEGLQPGTNFTWNLVAQRKLTNFLDLNLSYFGRKSPDTRTIHTGNVQLRAYF
ncbi:hypothetical protein [Croceiramulus getboli]|nr:hypothetical protein P8624_05975 [Flavobacteriaceae bacterium YJPT1-3]